jgi:hypothetical protein
VPLASYEAYIDALNLHRAADFQLSGAVGTASRMMALWPQFLPAPAVPTTSVALDSTSGQSIGPIPGVGAGALAIVGSRISTSSLAGAALIAIDLLNASGGLSGIVATEQTTNLPTAALTRYTTGEGVMIGLLIYTIIGTTATTVTVKYTNQAGTANRVSTAQAFGGTGSREVSRLVMIPLAAGDTGVRSVQGVTVAATTGTAGNFGVCLFRPLAMMSLDSATVSMPIDAVSSGGLIGAFATLDGNACLSLMTITPIAQTINGAILLAEV